MCKSWQSFDQLGRQGKVCTVFKTLHRFWTRVLGRVFWERPIRNIAFCSEPAAEAILNYKPKGATSDISQRQAATANPDRRGGVV